MRVAIWINAGISGGNFSQGIPAISNFARELARNNDVTVYSIFPVKEKSVDAFKIKSPPSFPFDVLRIVALASMFIWHHFGKPYQVVHGIWVYPAGTMAVLLGKLFRIPSIVSAHGGEAAAVSSLGYGNMLKDPARGRTLWTCRKASALNFISRFQFEKMEQHGLKRDNVSIIPFGTDLQLFPPDEKHLEDFIRILHVANLTEIKDQPTLLRAFAEIVKNKPAKLRIVGPDYMNGELQRLARELEVEAHVSFIGPVAYRDIPVHYQWADMMMHTSLYEGLPSAIVEAMACGVPVVSTRVGIVYDLGEEFFAICPFGDYNAIAESVLELLENQSLRSKKIEAGLDWAKSHDISWTVAQFEQLYQKTIR